MTGCAVDIEALLAAFEDGFRDGEGERGRRFVSRFAGVEMLVVAELALRDGSGEERTGRASVFEERAALERLVLGLIVHVLPATYSYEEQRGVRTRACRVETLLDARSKYMRREESRRGTH